jgi:hypothetical protein
MELGVPITARCIQCLLKVSLPDANDEVPDARKSSTREVEVVGCSLKVL